MASRAVSSNGIGAHAAGAVLAGSTGALVAAAGVHLVGRLGVERLLCRSGMLLGYQLTDEMLYSVDVEIKSNEERPGGRCLPLIDPSSPL